MNEKLQDNHIVLAKKTLTGDIRDFLLERLKKDHHPLPWDMRSEKEQEEAIRLTTEAANTFVRKVMEILDTHNNPAIPITVQNFSIKKNATGNITLVNKEDIHRLVNACGGDNAYIVLSSFEDVNGERSEVKINKDQKDLINLIENNLNDD